MNKNAQALGSLGGKARAKSLTKARKREIAAKAGKASAAKKKRRARNVMSFMDDCVSRYKAVIPASMWKKGKVK